MCLHKQPASTTSCSQLCPTSSTVYVTPSAAFAAAIAFVVDFSLPCPLKQRASPEVECFDPNIPVPFASAAIDCIPTTGQSRIYFRGSSQHRTHLIGPRLSCSTSGSIQCPVKHQCVKASPISYAFLFVACTCVPFEFSALAHHGECCVILCLLCDCCHRFGLLEWQLPCWCQMSAPCACNVCAVCAPNANILSSKKATKKSSVVKA